MYLNFYILFLCASRGVLHSKGAVTSVFWKTTAQATQLPAPQAAVHYSRGSLFFVWSL